MKTPVPTAPALPPVTGRELLALALLLLAVLATRLPFLMHGLDEWDSANFALSVVRFDVLHHQPHPPGQYVYVRLMQFINGFTGNPLLTLSLASAVASTLALAPFYAALRRLFRPAVALGAVALTASAFGYWITSLRMVSDPVACLFVYGTVCSLLLGLEDGRWLLFGMALCGASLGVKQTAVYFLAPLAVVVNGAVVWRRGVRGPLLGGACLAAAVLAWLLPTVANCGGWAKYLSACREMQQENYGIESIIFHLSPAAAGIQARHNFLEPWGAPALAVVMLPLAAAGLLLCLRRGARGALFTLFGLTVLLYTFFFLYRFNKYYVYVLPIYGAGASAAVFGLGGWLARRLGRPAWGDRLPAAAVALLTAANVGVTAPLLSRVSHFRAPPQAALEALHKLAGVEAAPLLLTDDVAAGRELLYFDQRKQVDLLNRHPDLGDATAALSAGRKIYFLSATVFDPVTDQPDAFRLLGSYAWRPELFAPLQGRADLRQLLLYEVSAPLPARYAFEKGASYLPLLLEGMSQDGWCGANVRLLLPGDATGPDLAHLRLTVPADFEFRFPYRMECRFADGSRQELTVEHAGHADFVIPLPVRPGAQAVELQLLAPQTFHLSPGDPRLTDNWNLAVHLDALDCVTPSRPLIVQPGEGWYGQETDGRSRWRWTDGDGELMVLADRAGTLVLDAAFLSATPGNGVDALLDGAPAADSPLSDAEWTVAAWRLPIPAGLHRVTLHSRLPGIKPPGDARTLALRVRDLQTRFEP